MSFVRYDKAIKIFYRNLDEIVKKIKNIKGQIVVFGTSKIAGMIVEYLKVHNVEVSFLIDNDVQRQNQIVFGVEVRSPQSLKEQFNEQLFILIASSHQASMIQQLEEYGYEKEKNIIKVIDLPKLMEDYSFVDRTGFVKMTKEEIRKSQLGVLKRLKQVCEENGIKYYLCCGTLLGAVRHKGFIPWDDDIDVYVGIKDLKKLSNILKDDPQYSLISFVDDIDYYDEISLMVDNSTILDTNHFPMQLSTGVSIDIFPISALPSDEKKRQEYISKVKNLDQIRWNKLYSKEECRKATNELVEYLAKYEIEKEDMVGNVLGVYFTREIMPKEELIEDKELEFEKEMFKVPGNYDTYLRKIYGDYMQLPPVEKRIEHHYFNAYHK